MTKLTTENILEVASKVQETIEKAGIRERCSIHFNTDPESFGKIDEDIYYKLNAGGSGEYAGPGDYIIVNYGDVEVKIEKNAEN